MKHATIRVLIVDDSILFREALSRVLSEDSSIEIIGKANDAYSAQEKIRELKPDVVTLDIEMPRMNGIELLRVLLPKHPVPVVVVTASPTSAFEALDAGAIDYVRKPTVRTSQDMVNFARELSLKIKIARAARLSRSLMRPDTFAKPQPILPTPACADQRRVIAIGASTGGTDAIQVVIQNLPKETPGVVIVQHMPAGFTKMYADRLDKICRMEVREAQDGDRVHCGRVLIAAGEFHMRLRKDANGYYVHCARGEKVSGHCPSVDVLFDSVAETAGKDAIGVILTGMGADGAKGLYNMRKAGAYTIGQDKDSCVVYGMPMVAFNIGGVIKQAPLSQIPTHIMEKLR